MIIKTDFSKIDHVNSGLALILITLILGIWINEIVYNYFSILLIVILLSIPKAIYPFTFVWLNFSEVLGNLMSKIILFIIFFTIVCPVALIRALLGKDSLRLKSFKSNKGSVFFDRDYTFRKSDLTSSF